MNAIPCKKHITGIRRTTARRLIVLASLGVAALAMGATPAQAGDGPLPHVLVFSKTEGFRHSSQIDAGCAMIADLGVEHDFTVETSEDAALFTVENLLTYDAIVFLNTTGDILNDEQQAAFEAYIASGRGFVGIHSATDTEYGWPFYGELIGAYFANHPAIQVATVVNEAPEDPSTEHIAATFEHNDEWYNFQSNPAEREGTLVLLSVDESTYSGGTMGDFHPVAWKREYAGGRAWYTAMGHTLPTYSQEWFRLHVLGGIRYAIDGDTCGPCPADLDGSCAVDFGDILAILSAWGNAGGPEDLDGRGTVDFGDVLVVLGAWGDCA